MKIRYAKESEVETIKEIWNYSFNDSDKFVDYYFKDKYKSKNTVVVEEGGEIVSSLQLNQYKLRLNNKVYDTSYVVGVSTFPQVRGRGLMKHIMEFTLKQLYKKNQLVSILMPIDYRLYRKYGYEHCYDQIEYNIDIDNLKEFKLNGRLHKADEDSTQILVDINKAFLNNINGNVDRDENYYKKLFNEVKSEDGHIYIHEDHGYEGYIIYFLNSGTMFVRELFYKNIDSLKSMLKFIYNHNTQCEKVTISAPINDKIRFILDNPKTCDIKIKPFMMGRVINLKKYLESLNINSDLEMSANIAVKDDFINENNGVFKFNLKNNKLTIDKLNEKITNNDNEININAITQLAFSYTNIEETLILNNIKISKDAEKLLEIIFQKKNNYINEYI